MNRIVVAWAAVALTAAMPAVYADEPNQRGASAAGGKGAQSVTRPAATPTASESTMPGAIRGRPESNRLRDLDHKAKQLKRQVGSLQASVARSGWNSARHASGMRSIHTAIAELGSDIKAFQQSNDSAQFQTGKRQGDEWQRQLTQIGRAAKTLGAARDANTAISALTQISASLDNVIRSLETLPLCCTERTCCYVGFR